MRSARRPLERAPAAHPPRRPDVAHRRQGVHLARRLCDPMPRLGDEGLHHPSGLGAPAERLDDVSLEPEELPRDGQAAAHSAVLTPAVV